MRKRLLQQSLCGVVAGLMAAAVLTAIAVPSFGNLPLPWPRAQTLQRVAAISQVLAEAGGWSAFLLALAFFCSWVMIARSVNEWLSPFPFDRSPRPGVAWTAVLASGAAIGAAVFASLGSGRTPTFFTLGLDGASSVSDAGALLFSAAGGAAAWLILAPAGWAGGFAEWRKPSQVFAPGWASEAALGGVFGALLCLGLRALDRLFLFLFYLNIEVWHPGLEIDPAALLINVLILSGLGAVAFAAAGSLAWALSPDELALAARLRRARPALGLLLLVSSGTLALHKRAVDLHQWRAGGLAEAARLPDREPKPMTLVTLGFDKTPQVYLKDWALAADCSGWIGSSKVAATEANVDALQAFLGGAGRRSRFRGQAADAVPAIYAALWEPQKSFSVNAALAGGFPMPLLGMLLERSWLAYSAPITPENRARLEELSDEEVYQLPRRQAITLARSWLRFGDLERARRWQKAAEKPEELTIPEQGPLAEGRVRGRIALKGKPAAGLRVGLFSVRDTEKSVSALYPGRGASSRLVGAVTTGADGSFDFASVGGGRYALSFLAPAEVLDTKALEAKPHPGILTLDRAHPRLELGTISLTQKPSGWAATKK